MWHIPSYTHIKNMKREIRTKKIKITLDSTKNGTTISINYKPESASGDFPMITGYEDYCIVKQICPFEKLKVKDVYSDNELIMITNFFAYTKATKDLTSNNIVPSGGCNLIKESDSSYTYTLCMPAANNEIAHMLIALHDFSRRKRHSERIKKGIQHHKKLREQS